MCTDYTFLQAFQNRTDLRRYDGNDLLLFTLELRYELDDIHTVAIEALTDGPNDKKCDLIFIDKDRRTIVIAQTYKSASRREAAPANKASDLNTAASWLFSRALDELPEQLRPAAKELRYALQHDQADEIEFWFVHNCPESENVKQELLSVENTAKTLISNNSRYIYKNIRALEVGLNTLERWYKSSKTPILVNEEFQIQIPGGYSLSTTLWQAYATAIPIEWIYKLYKAHAKDLFSANVRDYLGSRRSESNINNGIKDTAEEHADQFWAYNNGITALVNDFSVNEEQGLLTISGISIVNGAQTTGAIGSLESLPSPEAKVQARFIKCSNREVLYDIVRYNNSQNKIEAADFRSTDRVQERLRKEFDAISGVTYLGGRRGGDSDAIRRLRGQGLLPSDRVAQSLAAFHGEPEIAYNRKSDIWQSDRIYSSLFGEQTHAAHIIFVFGLHQQINNTKQALAEKYASGQLLTATENSKLTFLRYRGANFLLMSAIGACMEIFINRGIPDPFALHFKGFSSMSQCYKNWETVITPCLAFHSVLLPALENGLAKNETEKAIGKFRMLLDSMKSVYATVFEQFAIEVETCPWSKYED